MKGSYGIIDLTRASCCITIAYLIILCCLTQAHGQSPMCQDEWEPYKDMCYLVSSNTSSWVQAQHHCHNMEGWLATSYDPDVNGFLTQRLNQTCWLGLNVHSDYTQNTSVWQWSDGSDYNTNWNKWDDGYNPDDVCGILNGGTKWLSHDCSTELRYVCKKEIHTGDDCSDPWLQNKSHCYLFATRNPNRSSYSTASKVCFSNNAHLTSMVDEDEFQFIRSNVPPEVGTSVWIGLHSFYWDEPEAIYSWHNWDADLPDPDKLCTALDIDGLWRNIDCSEQCGFICQREPWVVTTSTTTTTRRTTPEQTLLSGATTDELSTSGYTWETTVGSEKPGEEIKDDYTWVWVLMGTMNGLAFIAFVTLLIIYLRLRIKYGPLPSRRSIPHTDSSSDDFSALDELPALPADSGIDNRAYADPDQQHGAVADPTGANSLYACVKKKPSTSTDIMTHRI